MTTATRPEFCTDEMLEYLDKLRESGVTNMFGAGQYLDALFFEPRAFGSTKEAKAVLMYWMNTFGQESR